MVGVRGSAIPEMDFSSKKMKKRLGLKKGGAIPNWAKNISAEKKVPRAIPLKKGGRVKRGRRAKR